MPYVTATDGTRLYYEEVGSGTPVVFVHEYAGDYRTWEPQLRYFARQHRCVTFSARGYPPSDTPKEASRYSQDIARKDVIAVMDGLGIAGPVNFMYGLHGVVLVETLHLFPMITLSVLDKIGRVGKGVGVDRR